MASAAEKTLPLVETFDEKQFYLDEFRGHSLVFSIPVEELSGDEAYGRLAACVRELLINNTRVLLLVRTPDRSSGEQVLRRLQRRLGPLIFGDDTMPLFVDRRSRNEAFLSLPADTLEITDQLLRMIWSVLRRGPLFVGILAGAAGAQAASLAQED